MNKFLSKVVATTLLSTVLITSANAFDDRITPNAPVWGSVNQGTSAISGGELLGASVDLNVTLNANSASDTHFTLNFNGGSIADTGAYALCNNGVQAGTYLAPETLNAAGRITAVVMEFKPKDGNTSLIAQGETIHFISGTDCAVDSLVQIIPDAGKCVTVYSNHGENTSGTVNIPDINSKPSKDILEYKAEIKISCTAPVCGVASDSLSFIKEGTSASINKREDAVVSFDRNTSEEYKCYTDGCKEDTTTNCVTYITLQNNTDRNLTKLSLTPTFSGVFPAGLTVIADVNGSEETVTSGSAIVVNLAGAAAIEPDANQTIKLTFGTDGIAIIPEGTLSGVISNIETNVSTTELAAGTVEAKDGIAKFVKGTGSKFTVTYMNPSFKSFAMITSTSSTETKLSATITDSTGATATATFADIGAGETMFVWADNAGHATDPLQVAADAAGLNNAWRVDFEVTSSVDVAAYMEANGGQRTLTVLYPEYSHDLTHAVGH